MAALSVVLGWLVAGRFLAPLRAMTTATRKISASNLHERLNLAGPDDEIKELGNTFDDLLGRLERSFDFERQFVANASHELRTPLATMRASLDVAMAKPGPVPAQAKALADRLRRELDQVDRLLDSFLTLSQAQQGPASDEATISLDDAVAATVERCSSSIALMGLSVDQGRCRPARPGERDVALPHGPERHRQCRAAQRTRWLASRRNRGPQGIPGSPRRRERRSGPFPRRGGPTGPAPPAARGRADGLGKGAVGSAFRSCGP